MKYFFNPLTQALLLLLLGFFSLYSGILFIVASSLMLVNLVLVCIFPFWNMRSDPPKNGAAKAVFILLYVLLFGFSILTGVIL